MLTTSEFESKPIRFRIPTFQIRQDFKIQTKMTKKKKKEKIIIIFEIRQIWNVEDTFSEIEEKIQKD